MWQSLAESNCSMIGWESISFIPLCWSWAANRILNGELWPHFLAIFWDLGQCNYFFFTSVLWNILSFLSTLLKPSVILAPYGLNGVLYGQSYKGNNEQNQKAWQVVLEWSRFYPIKNPQGATSASSFNLENEDGEGVIPPAVEVYVGKGFQKCYSRLICFLSKFIQMPKRMRINHWRYSI